MASLYYLHDDVVGGPDALDSDDFELGESAYAQSYQPVFDDFDLVDEEEPAKAQKIPFSSSQTTASSSSSSSSLLVAENDDAKQPDQWSRCYQTLNSPPVEEQSVSPLSRSPEDTRSRYSPSEPVVAPPTTKVFEAELKMSSTPPQAAPLPPMLHNTAGKERGPASHQFLSSHRLIRNVCRKSPSLSNLEPFLPKKTLSSSSHELSDDPSVSILQNIIEAKHAPPPSSSSTGYAGSAYDVDSNNSSNNEDDNDADFDLADSYNVADDGSTAYSPVKQQTTETNTMAVSETSTQQNGSNNQSQNGPVAKAKKTPHNILKRRNVQIALTQMQTGKNWNKEFQELELMQFLKEKYDFLAQLAEDFVQTSTAYAKIIISELCMPDTQKTIKPASVGGVAGGTKFLVQGILFKVAMDVEVTKGIWMYGGDTPRDDFAMKAANKEMTGLSACWQQHLPGLQFPLMAVIDYKGFRVVAVSLLPVGKNSLRYGSNDGGRTVHADDPVLNESMKQLMEGNFLKGHMVGSNPNNRKMIYGPGDIEGHLGSDGLYYVLDFGRMMPPEAPSTDPAVRKQEPRSVFYKLFRNEFLVRSYRKPLCSDAFTGWDASEPAVAEQNRQEIRDASNFLYKSLIPEFAAFFEIKTHKVLNHYLTTPAITTYLQNNPLSEGTSFSVFDAVIDDDQAFRQRKKTIQDILDILYTSLHLQGINLRHLGRLRSLCTDPISRKLILSAACARCIKHNVHLLWRETMVQESVPSEIPFTSNAVRFLNTLLGTGGGQSSTDDLQELKKLNEEQADFFWQQDIKQQLQQSFAMGLSPAELDPNYDLRDSIDMVILLQQLFYDLRLKLRKSVQKHLYSLNHENLRAGEFMFVRGDIKAMFEKVRSLPIANYSQSMSDLLESHELTPFIHLDFEFQFSEQPIAERINALNQRLESFAQGKNSRHLREYERARLLKSACNNFARTLRLIPLCFFVPNHWAFSEIALADLSITPQQQKRQLYLSAIERVNAVDNQKAKWIYFSQSYAYYKYATFLQSIGDQEQANKFFQLSADKEVASAAGAVYGGCDVFGKQGHTRVDQWEQPSLS